MNPFAEYDPEAALSAPLDISRGLRIRGAEASDLAALAQIAAEREGTSQVTQIQRFEIDLSNEETGQSMIFVADVCGLIVGFGKCAYYKVPAIAPVNHAPEGWHLTGVIVSPNFHRRRVGLQLTEARLQWLARRTSNVYYFASAQNQATIDLHRGVLALSR